MAGHKEDKRDAKELVMSTGEWSSVRHKKYALMFQEFDNNVRLQDPRGGSQRTHHAPHWRGGVTNTTHRPPIIVDSETYANVTIMAANLYMRTVGNDNEFVRIDASERDEAAATTQERLIKHTFKLPGHQEVWWKACYDLATYGLAWIKDPVEEMAGVKFGPFSEQLLSGARIDDIRPMGFRRKEMRLENIHVLDFLPDWTRPPGRFMRWGIEVGRLTGEEFVDFARHSDPEEGEAAARRVLKKNNPQFLKSDIGQRWQQMVWNGITEADLQGPDEYNPVQFFAWRGEVPWFDKDDPERYRFILVANDELVLNVAQPYYPHPWRALTMLPFNGRPFGMGTAEISAYDQDELTTYRTLRVRAALKTVNAPTLADSNRFENPELLEEPASEQVIWTRGEPVGAALQMEHRYDVLFTASQLVREGKEFAREANGIPDIARGIAAGARTTAFEASQLAATGALPLDVRVDLLEQEGMTAIGRDIPQRWLFALRDSNAELQISPDVLLQEITRFPGAQLSHLLVDLDMIFEGSKRFKSIGGLAGVTQQVAQLMTVFPGMAPFINIPRLMVDLLNGASPDAVQRYLLTPQAAAGQALVNEALSPQNQTGAASPPRQTQGPVGV